MFRAVAIECSTGDNDFREARSQLETFVVAVSLMECIAGMSLSASSLDGVGLTKNCRRKRNMKLNDCIGTLCSSISLYLPVYCARQKLVLTIVIPSAHMSRMIMSTRAINKIFVHQEYLDFLRVFSIGYELMINRGRYNKTLKNIEKNLRNCNFCTRTSKRSVLAQPYRFDSAPLRGVYPIKTTKNASRSMATNTKIEINGEMTLSERKSVHGRQL
mmetsp:Transcript_5291/g.19770  ORF Transcript_5291/g.19770 Transcript_5291/m.19770 type:complete len:216 (+) Transcript_5291:1797-2444(+)